VNYHLIAACKSYRIVLGAGHGAQQWPRRSHHALVEPLKRRSAARRGEPVTLGTWQVC